jgi:acyl-CoA thioesterase YciA
MQLISTQICKTSDIGVNNNLFGGRMLSWMDEAGATLASFKALSTNMITLKMDEVIFERPVKVNDHIRIYGKVAHVGTSSLSLYLEARRFNFVSHIEELVCSTKILFVNIDDEGHSKPINETVRKKLIQSVKEQNK